MKLGDTVPDVRLFNSAGVEVTLQEFVKRPTIVQCLRYYG